jgi:hypothetical protein
MAKRSAKPAGGTDPSPPAGFSDPEPPKASHVTIGRSELLARPKRKK